MINTLAILLSDTYKQTHDRMYPKTLKKLTSYWVPRKSMFEKPENQKMVWFGMQAFIQEWLIDYFQKNFFDLPLNRVMKEYKFTMNIQLGEGNYDVEKIEKLHTLGYLPLEIKALPEGSLVNMGVPCIELTNTLDDFAWLVQWVECILQSELWKTSNHATIGHMYYKLAKYWYDKTVDAGVDPRNAFADFGMRGMSCMNEAVRCSAAWLLSSNKTSTIAAIPYLDEFYDADCTENENTTTLTRNDSKLFVNKESEIDLDKTGYVFNKEITNTSIKYKLPDTGGSGIEQYYQAAFVFIALGLLVILVRYIKRRVG